jgi:hypothetical protein
MTPYKHKADKAKQMQNYRKRKKQELIDLKLKVKELENASR